MKIISPLAAAAALSLSFVLCSPKENHEADDGQPREMSFRVSAGEFDITKASLVDGQDEIHWSSKDKISLFAGDGNYFFRLTSTEEDGYVGVFEGEAPQAEHYYALFPSNASANMEYGVIKASVPSEQTAVKGGADSKALVMAGVSSSDEFQLQSAVALLGFSTDNDDVSSVRISLMKGQPGGLTGDILIEPSSNELSVEYDEGLPYVEVSGEFEKRKIYYATVVPGDYSGLTVTVSRSNGDFGVIDFDRPVSVAPGEGLVLGGFTVDENGWQGGGIRSYILNGFEEVRDFLEAGITGETVKDLTVIGPDVTSEQMSAIRSRVATVLGTFTMDSVVNDDYENNGKSLETDQIIYSTTDSRRNAVLCLGSVVIKNVSARLNCAGFRFFPSVRGGLTLSGCSNVVFSKSFEEVKSVNGPLVIENCGGAFSGESFASLERTEGDLRIEGTALADFSGSSLEYVGGDLVIRSNPSLSTLAGFDNLTYIGGNVVVTDNGAIPELNTDGKTGYCIFRDYRDNGIISGIAEVRLGISSEPMDFDGLKSCSFIHGDKGVRAIPANDFLASIGVNTAIASRGEWIEKTEENLRYTGIRWVRSSYSGDQREIDNFRRLHNNLGTKFSLMPPTINDNLNIEVCLEGGRKLAEMGALLAFEGPNEPNNWAITYKGKKGGGSGTWKPLAEFMRDFYAAIKSDPVLKDYPVWSASEMGAETDNVGLQYLIIPPGAGCLMPDGTAYATHACCHNYFIHPKWSGIHDNQTWCAADPIEQKYVDGLYDNHGVTWSKKYPGYSAEERETLPRVTTETGVTLDCTYTNWDGSTGSQNMGITEHMQGVMYVNCYLAQFVRGWANTAIYILRDRGDELSNQTFGMYGCGPWDYGKGGWSYTKRVSADYMHNFTTILEDSVSISDPGCLDYTIPNMPATSHELLLQKNDGTFFLVLWGERYKGGTDNVVVKLSSKWAAVRAYDVVAGTGVSKTYTNTDSVSVSLTDHPVILEFVK